ncbi:MAG: hypothetical protein N2378_05070 [Chloroflexaceae bacterium]|nr:hypothetical protein [Chloroflexaceae bacterium]
MQQELVSLVTPPVRLREDVVSPPEVNHVEHDPLFDRKKRRISLLCHVAPGGGYRGRRPAALSFLAGRSFTAPRQEGESPEGLSPSESPFRGAEVRRCFGRAVNLADETLRTHLSWLELQKGIAGRLS